MEAQLESLQATATGRRRARSVRWFYATGLRVAEISAARCADLELLAYQTAEGQPASGWLLTVKGKGGDKIRQVPAPTSLIEELGAELAQAGCDRDPRAAANLAVPILANFADPGCEPWTASGVYKALKVVFEQCAEHLQASGAERLRRASPHWLRHTHGTHALNGRPGRAPVPIQVVQNNLGHSSIGTTSGYLTTERSSRLQAMEGFCGEGRAPPRRE